MSRLPAAPPTLTIYWQAEIRKTDTGRLVRRTRKYRSRSFVNNFLRMFQRMMENASVSVTDISNTARTINGISASSWRTNITPTGGASIDRGIRVGSGTTAVDGSDINLATLITDGTAAGELAYSTTNSVGGLAAGASITSFDLTRSFGNSSGGTVSVEELGLCLTFLASDTNTYAFLLIRDLVVSTISVLDGETLTVVYTIKTTV